MADAISAIANGIAALLELVFHVIVFLAKRSITLISFGVSADYRARKGIEWQNRPARKVLALGFSGLCLATLCGLGIWFGLMLSDSKRSSSGRQRPAAPDANYLSLSWHNTNRTGSNQITQIVIAPDGIKKILTATNRTDLLSRIKSSMVGPGSTNVGGTNLSPGPLIESKFGRTVTEK